MESPVGEGTSRNQSSLMAEHLTDAFQAVLACWSVDSVYGLGALSHISWGWESGLEKGNVNPLHGEKALS